MGALAELAGPDFLSALWGIWRGRVLSKWVITLVMATYHGYKSPKWVVTMVISHLPSTLPFQQWDSMADFVKAAAPIPFGCLNGNRIGIPPSAVSNKIEQVS